MNSLSETDWLSEPHPLSEAAISLSRWETLEENKSKIYALSEKSAPSTRTLSLLALSAPTLA